MNITEADLERERAKHRKLPKGDFFRKTLIDRFSTPSYCRWNDKDTARKEAQRAVQQGRLAKMPCVICGDENAEAHHPDYSNPLYVVWLCKYHHSLAHVYLCQKTGKNSILFRRYIQTHPKPPLTGVDYRIEDKN